MILDIDIEILRALCRDDKIKWTIHALKRIRKRKILSDAVINAVLSGEIIEQYQDDKYFPSCLIFNNDYDAPLHAVVSAGNEILHIITAYCPTFDEWENDYKTRKGKE